MDKLLQEFEPVGSLYLRNDKKAVASISPDQNYIGFIMGSARSRHDFGGCGLILEDGVAARIMSDSTLSELKTKQYGHILAPKEEEILEIQEYTQTTSRRNRGRLEFDSKTLEKFLGDNNVDLNKLPDYLNGIFVVGCERYAIDTVGNKIRNFFETMKLRYSPSRVNERRELTKQLEEQIPVLADQLCQLLDELQESTKALPSDTIESFEELTGKPIWDLVDASKEEVRELLSKNVLKKLKFTGTNNKAKYQTRVMIKTISHSEEKENVFTGDYKINC